MEKRFALFLVLSSVILFGHLMLQSLNAPPPKPPADAVQAGPEKPDDAAQPEPEAAAGKPAAARPATGDAKEPDAAKPDAQEPESEPSLEKPVPSAPAQRIALGSIAPDSPYRLLVTLNNQGGAIERIELSQRTDSGEFRYRDLEASGGYLGHLGEEIAPTGTGCLVTVVGPGTPAALAGLQAGDVVVKIDDTPIPDRVALWDALAAAKAGQSIVITVRRGGVESPPTELTAELTAHPLSIVRPEHNAASLPLESDQLSCLLTLDTVGDKAVVRDAQELAGLPSLRQSRWHVQALPNDEKGPGVEFVYRLSPGSLKKAGLAGELEVVKRYRLAATPPDNLTQPDARTSHLTLEVEVRNLGKTAQSVGYRLDGPNGLPLEAWWYATKTHPTRWSGAGARDVIWRTKESGHGLISASSVYEESRKAAENGLSPAIPLFADARPHAIDYIGVDAQYFTAALLPDVPEGADKPVFRLAQAIPAGDVAEKKGVRNKTTNVTFRLVSQPQEIPAGKSLTQRFVLFAGPKRPSLLEQYGLEQCNSYGWFGWVAQPLAHVLHFFEALPLVNYGLAIILLTALVRGAMIPLSRKAAKNAQMMQELAPEMKRIADKYKNDMEKRAAAQRELWSKHHYNPFGGCLLLFIQLPIFIGLYRSLSVDIELRQAPLIGGLSWCSNLAGPDMLWDWSHLLPGFLADHAGWLGPYLNVLPIITIVLFLVQQKMFMPPATDEQTRMQQKMMTFMMIFMGVMFYKVPSGLCIYFIASSIWGIVERKVLPPVGKPAATEDRQPRRKKRPK